MPDWRNDAACLETDPEAFFAHPGSLSTEDLDELHGICAGCPVRIDCLTEELDLGAAHQWGFRGGYTEKQRKSAIRRKREHVLLAGVAADSTDEARARRAAEARMQRLRAEVRDWDDDSLREGRAAFLRGDRELKALAANREYMRRRKAGQRESA